MPLVAAVAILLVSLPAAWSHREGSGSRTSSRSGASSESLLAAVRAAGMSATELYNAVHSGVHSNLAECKESHHHVDPQMSVKKMESCVNAIASFAQRTQSQRDISLKANKNYANDLVLAKKLLKYLVKQTDTQEQQFRRFQNSEQQKRTGIQALLSRRPEVHHAKLAQDFHRQPLMPVMQAAPGSLLAMSTDSASLGYQAAAAGASAVPVFPPTPWANMAAMYTASGQNFGIPMASMSEVGLVGRRPSQLQVDDSAGPPPANLQARLDSEAERLEENDAKDLQGLGGI